MWLHYKNSEKVTNYVHLLKTMALKKSLNECKNIREFFSELLECGVCLNEDMNDSKILACGHSFCKPCLERLWNNNNTKSLIKCPNCREETRVSTEQGLSSLTPNFYVHKYTDICKAIENELGGMPRKESPQSMDNQDHNTSFKCSKCPTTVKHVMQLKVS